MYVFYKGAPVFFYSCGVYHFFPRKTFVAVLKKKFLLSDQRQRRDVNEKCAYRQAKGQMKKKKIVIFFFVLHPKQRHWKQIPQFNLKIMIMHLCVNNFECGIEEEDRFGDSFRPGAGGSAPRLQDSRKRSIYTTQLERLEYMCAFILPPLVSPKLFISSRSIQSKCVL